MRTLVAVLESALETKQAILEAVQVHDWTFALDDADHGMDDVISAIRSEIAQRRAGIPSDPIALQVAS